MTPAVGETEIPFGPAPHGESDPDGIFPDRTRENLSVTGSRIRAGAEASLIGA